MLVFSSSSLSRPINSTKRPMEETPNKDSNSAQVVRRRKKSGLPVPQDEEKRSEDLDAPESPLLPTPGFTFWHFQGSVNSLFFKKKIDKEWRAFCRLCGGSISVGSGGIQNLVVHINNKSHAKVSTLLAAWHVRPRSLTSN